MKSRMFDTSVQELKYKVLKEVATLAYEDRLQEGDTRYPGKDCARAARADAVLYL